VGVWLAALALLWLSLIIFTAFPSAISCVRIEVGGTVVTSFSHPLQAMLLAGIDPTLTCEIHTI
jgi:hypothetical protein